MAFDSFLHKAEKRKNVILKQIIKDFKVHGYAVYFSLKEMSIKNLDSFFIMLLEGDTLYKEIAKELGNVRGYGMVKRVIDRLAELEFILPDLYKKGIVFIPETIFDYINYSQKGQLGTSAVQRLYSECTANVVKTLLSYNECTAVVPESPLKYNECTAVAMEVVEKSIFDALYILYNIKYNPNTKINKKEKAKKETFDSDFENENSCNNFDNQEIRTETDLEYDNYFNNKETFISPDNFCPTQTTIFENSLNLEAPECLKIDSESESEPVSSPYEVLLTEKGEKQGNFRLFQKNSFEFQISKYLHDEIIKRVGYIFQDGERKNGSILQEWANDFFSLKYKLLNNSKDKEQIKQVEIDIWRAVKNSQADPFWTKQALSPEFFLKSNNFSRMLALSAFPNEQKIKTEYIENEVKELVNNGKRRPTDFLKCSKPIVIGGVETGEVNVVYWLREHGDPPYKIISDPINDVVIVYGDIKGGRGHWNLTRQGLELPLNAFPIKVISNVSGFNALGLKWKFYEHENYYLQDNPDIKKG